MSVNKYMHPRNIYKSPPNFKQLALDFPEFRSYVKQDISGKVSLDFKDVKALRALSCTLLKKDFDLIVDIPLNKLIPTIPLRLNYILWMEDLLSLTHCPESIKGIDIGTGASCIYPLLAAKKNNWKMVATEVDNCSVVCARRNIEANNLDTLIKVVEVNEDTVLKGVVKETVFDFCMCNPPFFGTTQELSPQFKSRKPDRPKPKNSFCASVNEVVVKGGEVDFITKLINESKELGQQIKIYSTMIGHQKSLPQLKKILRDVEVKSWQETLFCQGNTTRWGLAWTFCDNFDLKKCPDPIKTIQKQNKTKKPLFYKLQMVDTDDFTATTVSNEILKIFEKLQMTVEEVSRKKTCFRYFVSAFSNTWSNQRRKRREKLKQIKETEEPSASELSTSSTETSLETSKSSNDDSIDTDVKSPGKRLHDDGLDGTLLKKLKLAECDEASVFFKFTLAIRQDQTDVYLELDSMEEDGNRDYLHQILQYIKNNLKFNKD